AATGWGLKALKTRLQEAVEARQWEVELTLPAEEGKLLSYIEEKGRVLRREYGHDAIRLTVLLKPEDVQRVQKALKGER
ncbi:MAG TPA: DUF1949 domain-containing protein, partial [Armatimonadetes bacterium]|nr:DUF1949 domain-containing protein [Armatimonadota bacterium]